LVKAFFLSLVVVLVGLFLMEPMGSAVQIGADEGFELAKALLVKDGFRLYTDIWSDQPPLYTHILAWIISGTHQPLFWCRFATLTCSIALCIALFLFVEGTTRDTSVGCDQSKRCNLLMINVLDRFCLSVGFAGMRTCPL
jgi:hypothetical protein